jgi:hypothetical protein
VAESNKDLVLLLLKLRSVCAQNHGTVKVDEEFKNLCTLHSAVGYKQQKTVTDADYADEVLDRYESAIFTCGKFIGGQSIYDKVLANYSTPMTFREYLILSDADQEPIDAIVKERTVARSIIKNSLNDNARAELVKIYSVNNNSCYPNTVSKALSLLVTFKMKPTNNNNRTEDEAYLIMRRPTLLLNKRMISISMTTPITPILISLKAMVRIMFMIPLTTTMKTPVKLPSMQQLWLQSLTKQRRMPIAISLWELALHNYKMLTMYMKTMNLILSVMHMLSTLKMTRVSMYLISLLMQISMRRITTKGLKHAM